MKNFTTLLILLFITTAGGAWAKAPSDELSTAACQIVWAYYTGDAPEIDRLLRKYGDQSVFDKARLDLIHHEMSLVTPAGVRVTGFWCDSERMEIDGGVWMLIVRGTLLQKHDGGDVAVAPDWDFYIGGGRFTKIETGGASMRLKKKEKI